MCRGGRADVPAADTAAEACDVLEVGCGMGVLTQFLLRRTDLVTWGAEIDAKASLIFMRTTRSSPRGLSRAIF